MAAGEESGRHGALSTALLSGAISLSVSLLVGVNSAALDRSAEAARDRREAYVEFVRAASDCAAITDSEASTADENYLKVIEDVRQRGINVGPNANYPALSAITEPDCSSVLDGASAELYIIAPADLREAGLELRTEAVNLHEETLLLRHDLLAGPLGPEGVDTTKFGEARRLYEVALEDFESHALADVRDAADDDLLSDEVTTPALILGAVAVVVAASIRLVRSDRNRLRKSTPQ